MGEVSNLNEQACAALTKLYGDVHDAREFKLAQPAAAAAAAAAAAPVRLTPLTGSKSASWVTPHGSRAQTPAFSGFGSREPTPAFSSSASQSGAKSFSLPGTRSLPSLPELQVPQVGRKSKSVQIPQNVPAPMNSYDYWTAVRFFEMYDVHKTGFLDKQLFHKMISTCCVFAGLTRRMTGSMFESVDVTCSGRISEADFLAWIFGTYSCFTDRVRQSLASLDHNNFVRRYRGMKMTWTGYITKEDLWTLLSEFCPCPESLAREDFFAVFNLLDVHRAGSLDIEGFLDWLRPRRLLANRAVVPEDSRISGPEMPLNPSSTGRSALFETELGKPLVLEFTTSRDFHRNLVTVESSLRQHYPVSFSYIFSNDTTSGCSRLVALVGRGILLWDRMTMQAYIDNPVKCETSTRRWLRQLLKERMPRVLPERLLQRHQKFAPPPSPR
eukprot:TRINITY_DN2719_c4_g1_i1.p1 TRINITY_DN2719_c4_g1~~TRINITY_DN2719_c4_g1_i1.p1  ORF type:complete len:441 (+),score=60.28 TRINITY_DN2719_c4_g1_i1:128-1450(+)